MTCWLFLLIGSSESFSTHGDVLTVMWHTFHEKKIQSKKNFFPNACSVCQHKKYILNVAD